MSITNIWSRLTARWADRRQHKLAKALERDSFNAIQLMEFDGAMYISHNGTPVVCVDHLDRDAVNVIQLSRKAWIDYNLRELDVNLDITSTN